MEPSVTGARLVVDPASVTPDPRVPGSGVVQLHVVVPPSERDLRWGVAGIVERSDGGRWIPAGLAPGSYRLVQQGRTDTDPPTGSGRQIVGHVEVAASPG